MGVLCSVGKVKNLRAPHPLHVDKYIYINANLAKQLGSTKTTAFNNKFGDHKYCLYIYDMKLNNMNNKTKMRRVTIEKWIAGDKAYYWIVDEDGNGLDGYSKLSTAIDVIKCTWDMVRINNTIKVRS